MRVTWKVALDMMTAASPAGQRARLPVGAKLLSVQAQYDNPTAWFEVDPLAPDEELVFRLFGTGHTVDDDRLTYLGTTQHSQGSLVLHMYGARAEQ